MNAAGPTPETTSGTAAHDAPAHDAPAHDAERPGKEAQRSEPQNPQAPSGQPPASAPSRLIITLVIVAIALTLGVVAVGFVVASNLRDEANVPQTGPLAVAAAPAPGASGRYCSELMPKLPIDLDEQPLRELIAGEPGVAAWGDPAIVLRCGLPNPVELTCSAQLTRFTGADGTAVEWLRIAEGSSVTFLAVDRPVRIAVTVPDAVGISPVQQLSDLIGGVLPAQAVCTASGLSPVDNS